MVVNSQFDRAALFGNLDANIKLIEEHFGVEITERGSELIVGGEKAQEAEKVISELIKVLDSGEAIDTQKINYIIGLTEQGISYRESDISKDILCFTHMGKPIKAKTIGQKKYADSIRKKDVVFGIGPAGTGKTYLAVAMAIHAYKNKEVEKIILARPAVEAGERLGFLPGDLQERLIRI